MTAAQVRIRRKEIGNQAELDFQSFLEKMGAEKLDRPQGDPGLPFAFATATRDQDIDGVDIWLWHREIGFWIPLDLSVLTPPEFIPDLVERQRQRRKIQNKRERALERGVVLALLRRRTLRAAATGDRRKMQLVWGDLGTALDEWLRTLDHLVQPGFTLRRRNALAA